MGSTEGSPRPLPGVPVCYLVHDLQCKLVQVQASLAHAVRCRNGEESCHGPAKAACSSEHQQGHLLSPKHRERARLARESPSQGHGAQPETLAAHLILLRLALQWMDGVRRGGDLL